MDPRDRFTATVEDYRRHRPEYPGALFDWLVADASLEPGDVVADVGCGTGISSRQLAARGLRVIAIDPNEAMLEAARREGGDGIEYVLGDAESLPIEGRVAAVVGGQSFHWFDLDRALVRFRQVLRPKGRVVAFWNLRDREDPFMASYEDLLLGHSPEYAAVGAEPRARAILARTDLRDRRQASFPSVQELDRHALFGRVWSSSYVRHGVRDRASFDRALGALFDEHEEKGAVRFVYQSTAIGFAP